MAIQELIRQQFQSGQMSGFPQFVLPALSWGVEIRSIPIGPPAVTRFGLTRESSRINFIITNNSGVIGNNLQINVYTGFFLQDLTGFWLQPFTGFAAPELVPPGGSLQRAGLNMPGMIIVWEMAYVNTAKDANIGWVYDF